MQTFDLPVLLEAAQFQWSLSRSGVQFRSNFNGTAQSLDFVADRWTVTVSWPAFLRDEAGEIEALADQLAGGFNRLRLWHMTSGSHANPGRPRGTLRGAPTLAANAARGDRTITIKGAVGGTLLAGDMVRVNDQMLRVAAKATLLGGSFCTVPVVNRVRAAAPADTSVEWDRPTADFIVPAARVGGVGETVFLLGQQWDLEEVW